jgi:hypothetical protein
MRHFVPTDLEAVNVWLSARALPPLALDSLPLHGWIEPAVAVGFLYLTDSVVGLAETFVANPECSQETRKLALDSILEAVIACARSLGVKRLFGMTRLESVRELSQRHGFQATGTYTMLNLNLE